MYLLPFAALAMASCSSSEDVAQNVQSPSQELKFFPAVEGTTRGAIETTASISKFYVYADGDLRTSATAEENENIRYSTPAWQAVEKNGSSWELKGQKLWWASDEDLGGSTVAEAKFTAFANALGSAGVMENATEGKLVNVTIPEALASQKDLVVAYNAGKRTDFLSGVPLHFRHALSQIVVNATYNKDATADVAKFPELDIKIKGVKFVNLANQGTLTLPTASTAAGKTYEPNWSGVTGTKEFAANPAADVTLASAAQYIDDSEAGNPLLLMPQTTAATKDLAATENNQPAVTGAYLMVQVDINYKTAFKPNGASYKMIDLYPKPTAELNADQENADNDSWAWIAVPVDIAWKGGYKYTYTLNFSNIAAGKAAPGSTEGVEGVDAGDPVIKNVRTPVNFLVTVEEAWIDGGSFTPAL